MLSAIDHLNSSIRAKADMNAGSAVAAPGGSTLHVDLGPIGPWAGADNFCVGCSPFLQRFFADSYSLACLCLFQFVSIFKWLAGATWNFDPNWPRCCKQTPIFNQNSLSAPQQ